MKRLWLFIAIVMSLTVLRFIGAEPVTMIQNSDAQIFIDNKVVGTTRLQVGQDFELVGVLNNQFLLQQGTSQFLVNPLATDYWEHGLLAQLRGNAGNPSSTAPSSGASNPEYVADVTIYPSASSNTSVPPGPTTTVNPVQPSAATTPADQPPITIRDQPPAGDVAYVPYGYYTQPYIVQPYFIQSYGFGNFRGQSNGYPSYNRYPYAGYGYPVRR